MIRSTLATAAVLSVALAAPAHAKVMHGTDGDDEITGTRTADVILGFDGDDVLDGRRGSDDIKGGDGDDHLWPGADDREGWEVWNFLEGGAGNDVMHGGPAAGYSEGNAGNDVIMGGPSFEHVRGNEGDDRLRPGEHGDAAEPDFGADIVRMGNGRDYVYLYVDSSEPGEEGAVDRVFCGHGEDFVHWGGNEVDPNDVIHESCEDDNMQMNVSRQEFVNQATRAHSGR